MDPEFRGDALEGRKAHSVGEAEVDYNLMKLVSGEDEQAAEPLHEGNGKLENGGGKEQQSNGKQQSNGAVAGGENGHHHGKGVAAANGDARAVATANGKAQQQGLR